MADATGTPNGVVSDEDYRINQAGLIAPQTSTLAVRTGVMHGPGTTALVTGTSATGTMTVSIAAHHWVTTRGTADGIYLGTLEAATTVNIAAAPGSNSRIDVVYVKQNDANSTVTPDGSTGELYGVVTGTAAVSPTKPSIPVGAVELATVQIAAGTTSTNGAGATITNTALQTVARGAPIPVRNQAERDALTPFWPLLTVKRLDTGAIEMRNAANTAWVTVYDPNPAWVDVPVIGGSAYAHTQFAGTSGNIPPKFQYRIEPGRRVAFRGWVLSTAGVAAGNAVTTALPAAARPAYATMLNPINDTVPQVQRHEVGINGVIYAASRPIGANQYIDWEGVSYPLG